MTKAENILEAMRRNPANNWVIGDVEKVCKWYGASCTAPSGGGSHYKISHDFVPSILTIPARRPIKAFYIGALVKFIDWVIESLSEKKE